MRNLFGIEEVQPQKKKDENARPDDENAGKKAGCKRTLSRQHERRIKSELALEDSLPWHMVPGEAYHCFSFGDVDSLTYFRAILKQQRVEYAILSTWCMAMTDVDEIKRWIDHGDLGRIDFYVGEIFQASYAAIYIALSEMVRKWGGRVAIFRNHSKVIAGFGERFDFAIESSANVNTNPRSEQTCITLDTGLARFYKEEIFDGISSFNKDFENWKPYKLKRDEII